MEDIKIITGHAQGEITEKKSRFIANVYEIHSQDEAFEILEAVKKQHYNARHNCYAFSVDEYSEKDCGDGNSGTGNVTLVQRFSDDGEPSGTAGKPMLEVLIKQGYHNTLIVVTRYFGGILLGTGGLTRAYSQAAKEGLESARSQGISSPLYYGTRINIECSYALSGKLQYIFSQDNVHVLDTQYGEGVMFSVIVQNDLLKSFVKKITEATSASAQVSIGDNLSYIIKDGQAVLY